MKLEVRKARAAAVAANLAAQAAVAARELLAEDPSAWEVGDAAYWLCRAAQEAAQNAADALDPEETETSADVFAVHLIFGFHWADLLCWFCGLSATLGAFRLGAFPAIFRRSGG